MIETILSGQKFSHFLIELECKQSVWETKMPANRMNYIVIYDGHSQVFGAGSEAVALSSPPPKGFTLEQKHIFFVTYEPDSENLAVYELDRDKVVNAEIAQPKTKKKKEE